MRPGLQNTKDRWSKLQNALADLVSIGDDSVRERAGLQFADEVRRIASESAVPIGALKELLPFEEGAAEDEAAALDRMKRELSTLESVNHPSLVRVLDSNLDQKWFVMEYIEGGTLSNRLGSYKGMRARRS